ncbi:poly [ADP-ribose] polymerase 14-like isoform X2 [Pomacea canaliculata]|nr:poly [ADP-ribose] polymerase 14-like isoform X2 [Pomacea canaliculata]
MKKRFNERCEEVPVDVNTYSLFVKNHTAMKEIRERSPQLKVTYDELNELLRLTGTESEIDEVKKFCQKINVSHHTWDMEVTRELFHQTEAQSSLQTMCHESDPEGGIAFTEDGIIIYSLCKTQVKVVKDACLKHVRREKIYLSEEFADVCRTAAWNDFQEKLKHRSKGTVLIREEPTCLTVVGVGESFDTFYTEAKQFLAENAITTRHTPVEEDLISLYHYYLEGNAASHGQKKARKITYLKSCISVTGTVQVVSAYQRAIESIKMMIVSTEQTLNLPLLSRFLTSAEGKKEVAGIEKGLKCKILYSNNQDFTSAQSGGSGLSGLQIGDQGATFTTGATGGFIPRNFAEPKIPAKGKILPAKPRISVNTMSDITKEKQDVLVNSSNKSLNLSWGQVSKDLLRVGGRQLQQDCTKKYPKGINFGEIAVTGKGHPVGLFCKNVIHCCLKEEKDQKKIEEMIKETTSKCLQKVNEMGHSSIGFPAIGTGTLKFPPKIVAKAMFEAAVEFGHKNPYCHVKDVVFILHEKDQVVAKAFNEVKDEYAEVSEDSESDLQANPNLQGTKKYGFFEETSRPLAVVFVGLDPGIPQQAEKALIRSYEAGIKHLTIPAQDLNCWDDLHISHLIHTCKVHSVDLTLMFESKTIGLCGFLEDVSNVRDSEIMKVAQQYTHVRRHARLMSKQVRWCWIEVDTAREKVRPYDETNNYMIEKSYREGHLTVFVSDVNHQVFQVRFNTMDEIPEHISNTSAPVRVIRQDLVYDVPDAPLPLEWSPMGTDYKVEVTKDSPDYSRTVELFRSSYRQPSCKILEVYRIENPTLHRQYIAKMAELRNSLPFDTLVERVPLWHGTKRDRVHSIITHGFNRSYCEQKDSRNVYGNGVYFATSAEHAARQEYAAADDQGRRRVFLCRVLVGQYTRGQKGMRFLPPIPDSKERYYNSAVDDPKDPSLFVVFNDTQAYPKYLIVFQ